MFLTFKKRSLIIFLCFSFCLISVGIYFSGVYQTSRPSLAQTILIDAGHGGNDGGASGAQTKITESYLNLQYALTLKKICLQFGYKVLLTRNDMSGLYSPLASNKKRSEMEKRKTIIEQSNPDIVVSIHMNCFPSAQVRGPQIFYAKNSQNGQTLAESIQKTLNQNMENSQKNAKVGDYYILNCTPSPSILIECGFLSNPEEELLLQDKEYMHKFCYNVLCGILLYYSFD